MENSYVSSFGLGKNTRSGGPVPNEAGGTWFVSGKWTRMKRWLVLGSDGNIAYASTRTLTMENAGALLECLHEDSVRYLDLLVEARWDGFSARADTSLFALAVLFAYGNDAAKEEATKRFKFIVRTGADLQMFVRMATGRPGDRAIQYYMRGWGRSLRRAVSQWFTSWSTQNLAYQLVKYRKRSGTSMGHVIKLSHVKPQTDVMSMIFKWAVGRGLDDRLSEYPEASILGAFKMAMSIPAGRPHSHANESLLAELILTHRLPWEAIPNQWLDSLVILEALLVNMPMIAMTRHISRFARAGAFSGNSRIMRTVLDRLGSEELLTVQSIHPMHLFKAYYTYSRGHGQRSTWPVRREIVEALEDAFFMSFKNVEPTGNNVLVAVDTSLSMTGGAYWGDCSGMIGVSPMAAAAGLALLISRTEPFCEIVSFSSKIRKIKISGNESINDMIRKMEECPHMATNLGAAIEYGRRLDVPVDLFVAITDNEMNMGTPPGLALSEYQEESGTQARAAFMAMKAYSGSVADPRREDMLDFVGFDPATPVILSKFSSGALSGIQD